MTAKFQDLLTEIEQKATEVKGLFDAADTNGGEMATDARDRVKTLNREIEQLESRAADLKEADGMRAANEARLQHIKAPASGIVHPSGKPAGGAATQERPKSLGERFLESEEWQGYFKGLAPTGHVGEKTSVNSPKLVLPIGLKTLVTGTSDTSAGAFVVAAQSGIYESLGRRPLTIRDIISVRTTSSDLVEYVRQVTRVNAAAPVAEATGAGDGTGVKPEGGMTFLRVQAPVKTIAEWIPTTKRSLSDAGQMRGLIDQELRDGYEEELEDQILTGDNTGENFEGLDAVSGTQDQAYSTNLLTTTRKARTLVRTVGRAIPTAYVMNPSDWETFDLLQDNEARYFYGGPSQLGTPRLWGLPVVESEAQPTGNAWVGDWRKIVLWDREQFMISVSDSHSDFFIRNLVAILGEGRAALGITRPSAFVEVDLTP